MHATRAYGIHIEKILGLVPSIAKTMAAQVNYTKEKMARRLRKKTDRKDFVGWDLHWLPATREYLTISYLHPEVQ